MNEYKDQIKQLLILVFDEWKNNQELLDSSLEDTERKWFVMKDSEQVVACASIDTVGQRYHLMNFCVHPDRRREGIATKLLTKIYDKYKDKLFWEVNPEDKHAIDFYNSLDICKVYDIVYHSV